MVLNVEAIRKDFPILDRKVHGKRLVYLDSAATSQKPVQVLDAMRDFYVQSNANVHRAIHELGEEATRRYEDARLEAGRLIGTSNPKEVVFTKNTTESLNILAYSLGLHRLAEGDEILLTEMEHHSNIVPWQQVAKLRGIKVRYAPITREGRLDLEALKGLVSGKTKVVSTAHVSNMLGTVNPVRAVGEIAHDAGALFVVDAAQSVPHMPVDVGAIGCDFLAFSGHKMLGPTGIGVLWGREAVLETLTPFLYGGEMIKRVSFEDTRFNDLPYRFEAGTPVIAEAVGLHAAIAYLHRVGFDDVHRHELDLTRYAFKALADVGGVTVYGPPPEERGGVVSFNVDGIHPHDLATILNDDGVAIRAGHHCAQPLAGVLGIPASARASFYLYNTQDDIDALAASLRRAKRLFHA